MEAALILSGLALVCFGAFLLWVRPWVDDAKKDNDLIGD